MGLTVEETGRGFDVKKGIRTYTYKDINLEDRFIGIHVKKVGSDYHVLQAGFDRNDGRFFVSRHDYSGNLTNRSSFMQLQDLVNAGYENLFDFDLNGDGNVV